MEVNLLDTLPQGRRDIAARLLAKKDPKVIELAKQFGKEYFDGPRTICYGGYVYDARWKAVARRMQGFYGISIGWRVLDVGCSKGFLLHDILELVPGVEVAGIDISSYAIEHAMADVKPLLQVGDAQALPYADHAFDLAISINTLHNLPLEGCAQAIRELMRVSRHQYLQVDSWRDETERQNLVAWSVTAETFLSVPEWIALFTRLGYRGDYFWTFIA